MKYIKSVLILLFLLFAPPAHAMVLRGVVTEVRDGETVVVFTNNQKVTVLLKGVDAPEMKQEFGETAQQHLASLVLNRIVEVDFSELRAGNVLGRLICNNMDIGLQVIRDGAAWYDAKSDHNLAEADRRIYGEAQQAARTEQRGLWQDGSPMPPWEWRRAQAAKQTNSATYKNSRKSGLGREDVLFRGRTASSASGTSGTSKSRVEVPKTNAKPLNTPGQNYDFRPYLTQGRISVVYFYADWCPACRQLSPLLDEVHRKVPDMQVLFMNIDEWNTPVAQQHGISFVPYLKIYDKNGNLIVEGKAARSWLVQELSRRM